MHKHLSLHKTWHKKHQNCLQKQVLQLGLGEAQQAANLRDIQLLSSLGGQEQAQQQSELDALRSLHPRKDSLSHIKDYLLCQIYLQEVPSTATTLSTTTTPDPSRISQAGGLPGGVASLQEPSSAVSVTLVDY